MRLDGKSPELEYLDKRYALYSTGFVLVRHRLQLPPEPLKPEVLAAAPTAASNAGTHAAVPASAAASADAHSGPAPKAPPPDETLTFFSLYNARWFSTDADKQAVYRKTLESITPKIVNSFQ
jgi:hypothetical protein